VAGCRRNAYRGRGRTAGRMRSRMLRSSMRVAGHFSSLGNRFCLPIAASDCNSYTLLRPFYYFMSV
jgi:hypothetical protein